VSKPLIFTKAFWMDAADRVISTAAQSVGAVIAVDQVVPNAFSLDYKTLGGVAAGGALLALVKLLGKQALTAQAPSVRPPTDDEIREYVARVSAATESATPTYIAAKSGGDVE
jgi:hypothetical protein